MSETARAALALKLVPLTRYSANAFVELHHRHCKRVASHRGALGAELSGELVGVVIIANPNARGIALRDRYCCEIVRLCVSSDAPRNTASWLYARARRAAAALGFRRVTTVTLDSESGASLRAAGFTFERELAARAGWTCPARPRGTLATDGVVKRRWSAESRP